MLVTPEQAISLPFTILPNGSVATTTDPSKIWADRVLSVVGTAMGERLQNYTLGTKIHYSLFSTLDSAEDIIRQEISNAFIAFLPMLSYIDTVFEYEEYGNVATATVKYQLPNENLEETTIGTVILDGNSQIKEI